MRWTLLIGSLLLTGTVLAADPANPPPPAGAVANLSGPLSAKGEDGSMRVLGINSAVRSGDTLYTEKDTYARVKFADGGEITLRPNSQMAIEKFEHAVDKPNDGNAFFRLVKGGLRAISGLIGKNRREGYRMDTPTATIGIRGTHFGLIFCQDDCGNIKTASGGTPENGLHVDIAEGAVFVSTQAGGAQFSAGENALVRTKNDVPLRIAPENAIKVPPMAPNLGDRNRQGNIGQISDQECVVQ